MIFKTTVQEVVTDFTSRSEDGRVIVNPGTDSLLKVHKTETIHFCCGTAFLSDSSLIKHKEQKSEHNPTPIDLKNVRMALNTRSSSEFWQTRKRRAAKTFNEDGEEMDVEEGAVAPTAEVDKDEVVEDNGTEEQELANGDKSGEEEDVAEKDEEDVEDTEATASKKTTTFPRRGGRVKKRKARVAYSSKKRQRQRSRKGTMRCEQCDMDISITNMNRHYKTCHNPAHEFQCRYCSCRFEVAYGRMVHELRNHEASMAAAGHVPRSATRKAALQVKKKLVQVQVNKPTLRIKMEPRLSRHPPPAPPKVLDHKHIIPDLTPEQQANCDAHLKKLDKIGNDKKARYECTICNKTFNGSRNAHDHMNSHSGLKPYRCTLCSFRFSFRSNVARHIRTCHTENSNFVCPYGCGCSMISDASLKIHMNLVCTLRHQFQNTASKPRSRAVVKPATPTAQRQQAAPPSSMAIPMQKYSNFESSTPGTMQEASRPGNRVLKDKFVDYEVSPGIYRCDQCSKNITGSGNFRDHLNIHANIRPHKCPKCYMCFTFKSNIRRHLASAHVLNGQFKCPMRCGCSMDNQHALQSHLNKCKTEIVKHRKVLLGQQTAVKMRQGTNSSTVINGQIQPMVTAASSSSHKLPPPPPLQKILPRPPPLTPAPKFLSSQYPNVISNSTVPSPTSATSSPLGKYQCDICGKSVSCQRNLTNHKLIHLGAKPCKCLICGLFFRTLDTLKKHKLRSHAANSPFKCDRCTCRFTQLQGLNMHTNIHHNPNRKQPGPPSASSAKLHQYQSPVIKMEVQQQDEVEMENIEEEGEEEDNSGNIVTPQINLSAAKTADGWKCHICSKVLKKLLHLKNHMRIHSGEKPFQCPHCGVRFRLASTLYDHKKSSHRGGEFVCELCPCGFETMLGLSRHKGIFHNTQAHEDYLQRRVRLIREKAVKSAFNQNQNRARPTGMMSQDLKPIIQRSTITSSPPKRFKVEGSILQKRLNVPQSHLGKQQNAGSNAASTTATTSRPNAMFMCGHCPLSLPSLNALSEHQKVHQSPPKARQTPTVTYSTPARAAHTLLNLNEPGPSPRTCPICQQSIHGRTHYNKHMTGCHSGGPFRCPYCPCTFDSQGNLSRHHTLMHPNINNRSNTGKGGSSTVTSSYNNKNVAYTNNDNGAEQAEETYEEDQIYEDQDQDQQQWDWSQVEASYSTENTEENQAEEQQDGAMPEETLPPYEMTPQGKIFTCPDCNKQFDKMNRYRLHVTIHTNKKPYPCKYCGQNFRLPGILATHVKKSHGEGQFQCQLCNSRFTSAKGLSVHEFVYHKGGRAEREVLRGQVVQMPVLKKSSPVQKPNRSIPPPAKVTNVQYSNSISSSTSRSQFPHQKQVLPTLTNKPKPMPTTIPRPVKLKCHICAQIFFGTTSLKEHMKEHSMQNVRRPQQQQQFSNQVLRAPQNYQPVSQRNNTQFSRSYQQFNNGQPQQMTYASVRGGTPASRRDYSQNNPGTSRGYQEIYEDDQEQGTFQIVGYENGYEDEAHMDMEEEQGDDMEYEDQYDDGNQQQQQDEYYGEENYDYINAEDHLEIVHEENNFGYDGNDYVDAEGYGVEFGEDNSQQDDNNDWNYDGQNNDIYCKSCELTFDSRDSFAYHVENTPTTGTRCSYCCAQVTDECLPDHIEQMHPMDEIEFIESQVYNDS